jgi:hypothetical protein
MSTAVRHKGSVRYTRSPHGAYDEIVARAVSSRSSRYFKLNTFGNVKSALTIVWMVQNGKGLKAFAEYVPGTFEAEIRDETEVWFRVRG